MEIRLRGVLEFRLREEARDLTPSSSPSWWLLLILYFSFGRVDFIVITLLIIRGAASAELEGKKLSSRGM